MLVQILSQNDRVRIKYHLAESREPIGVRKHGESVEKVINDEIINLAKVDWRGVLRSHENHADIEEPFADGRFPIDSDDYRNAHSIHYNNDVADVGQQCVS